MAASPLPRGAMNLGVQPLDSLMEEWGLKNHDLVASSAVPLTHKEVAKARKGRRLTGRTQWRVLEALNRAVAKQHAGAPAPDSPESEGPPPYHLADLFTYRGRRDPAAEQ